MFGLNNKNQDPQDAINKASNVMNKGFLGGITKAFMGADFVEKANQGLAAAQGAIDGNQKTIELMASGLAASAEVLDIKDTGTLINYNPVVMLKLKVTPEAGEPFESETQTMVSKIAIPRVGDTINIKYDAQDKNSLVIV